MSNAAPGGETMTPDTREALERIKALVTGERAPNWASDKQTYATRLHIADICDAALSSTPTRAATDATRCTSYECDRSESCTCASPSSTTATPDIRRVLREHWLTSVECLHDAKQDVAHCYCTVWASEPQLNVSAAVEAWVNHVTSHLGETPTRHPDCVANCCQNCDKGPCYIAYEPALPSSRALSSDERSFIEDVALDADDKRSTYGQKTVKRLLAIIDRLNGAPK